MKFDSDKAFAAQHIKQLIDESIIQLDTPVDSDQIQPASIDLRLGDVAYAFRFRSKAALASEILFAPFLGGTGETRRRYRPVGHREQQEGRRHGDMARVGGAESIPQARADVHL